MTVILLGLGSRGDVEPLVALAAGLRRNGLTGRVVGLSAYAQVADQHGIEYHAVPAGLERIARDASTGWDVPSSIRRSVRRSFCDDG